MDITPIINAAIALLAALVTAFVVPWLKGKIGAQNLEEFRNWVTIAVTAAEQLYDSADGETKKQYVLNFLTSKGFDVDVAELENVIEAVVLELHHELYGTKEVAQ